MSQARRTVPPVSWRDVATLASAIATVIAAVAAVLALREARKTVTEARTGRMEAHAAYELEAEQRRRALEAEIAVRRLEQLTRITANLGDVIRIAEHEEVEQPGQIPTDSGFSATAIPPELARLRVNVSILDALGVHDRPNVADKLARTMAIRGQERTLINGALRAYDEIEQLARNSSDYQLPYERARK
jgi:hypothetical protein